MRKPNILYIMCDQFRYDCIRALGTQEIFTPNIDRLVKRGLVFENAYSTCPVCVPARYTVRTGREPALTGCYQNEMPQAMDGLPEEMQDRCGDYLATAMRKEGYYTFGIGKFHTVPEFKEDLGYDLQLNTEELWECPEDRANDAYYSFIRKEHPEYNHIEQLHGERTNMYYVPQVSPLPAELTVESFVADRVIEQLKTVKDKPYFGFVSFIGPHPPCAPPVPFNRMYNPDSIANPLRGKPEIDFMDEQILWMNYLIWADELNDFAARNVKSRYYGEITYIDTCIGRILDAVEAREDSENTLICFFSDHGDHLGDHHAWQKESYFEQSCHIPFLISWPAGSAEWKLEGGRKERQLVCLTDLFGIATQAAGNPQIRDGHSILNVLAGKERERETLFACYGRPGTPQFKTMIRQGDWKYIYMANGGKEQLFHLIEDPEELVLYNIKEEQIMKQMRKRNLDFCGREGLLSAKDKMQMKSFSYKERPRFRIHQFDLSGGIHDFGMN